MLGATMAAGLAAMDLIEKSQATLYPELSRKAEGLSQRINRFADERQLPVRMMNAGSMLHLGFERTLPNNTWHQPAPRPEAIEDFFLHMLAQGVLMPASRMILISTAHTDAQIELIGDATTHALQAMQEDGLL